MAYAGHLGSVTELDELPSSEFNSFFEMLQKQMREERAHREQEMTKAQNNSKRNAAKRRR